MPNWVYNRMTITAPAARREEIKRAVRHDDKQLFSFDRILPRPAEEEDNWYQWNVDHWGTKWDACDPDLREETAESVSFGFRTAWSPPMPVIEAFANAYPDVDFDFWYEEEQGWGGTLEVRKGQLVKHDQYDIPESHAELVARTGECYCSSGDHYFDDCFYEQAKERGVSDASVLEAVKSLGPGWGGSLDDLIEAAHKL